MPKFYGKYRGKVENNVDPENRGRLQVSVPAVLKGGKKSWALPCVPFAGKGVGLFVIPPNKANVWVEFEAGETKNPIWCGGFWSRGEAPVMPAVAGMKVLKTDQVTIMIDDGAGSISIETKAGAKFAMGPGCIEINNGSGIIRMDGREVVINDDGLKVI